MKKTFTKIMLLLFALIVEISSAWAQEKTEDPVYSLTFSKNTSASSYTDAHTTTASTIEWSVYGNQSLGNYLRVGGRNTTNTDRTLTSSTAVINKKIYKVIINHNGLGNGKNSSITINSIKVEGSTSSSFPAASTISKTISSPSLSVGTPGNLTFEPDNVWDNNSYFRITVNYKITGSNNCYITINSIDFYEQISSDTPSIDANNVNVAYNANEGTIEATINNAVEGGELSAEITGGNDGYWLTLGDVDDTDVPLTINSNNNGVISRTATVTLTYTYNTNQTTNKEVTVTQGVNPIYGSSTNPYTVAQAIAVIDAAGKTTVNDKYVTGIVSQVDSYNSTHNSITYWISDDGTTTDQFEVYGGLSFDGGTAFSSKDDIQVGDVVVVKGNITYYSNNSVYEFQANNNLISLKLVAPTFYPAAGAVGSGTALTISDDHTDATIYYTTNGVDPTTSSAVYDSNKKPTITEATTFKAIVVKTTEDDDDNFIQSDVATASYTILTPVATPVITLAGGTYTYAQLTTITCDTEGATIYYTTNGSAPTTSSTAYTGAISINESMTIKAIAAKDGMANSSVAEATYTITLPVINASNINLACDATSGSIPYTITNSDGGTLTADITGGNEGSWLTCGAVSASAVALSCSANENTSDRSATITLTYTYQTNQTVTKEVTVTQAAYFPTPTSDDYVRISSLDQLVDGCIVIIAARYNSTSNAYYAMANTTSGKPTGTSFTSATNNDNGNEILPASLLIVNEQNVQASYYWVVNITEDGYTFTNPSKDKIGYGSSGTSFVTNGNKTEWSISKATSASTGPMVTSYSGFVINNTTTTDRDFAFNGSAFGAYSTGNNNMASESYNFYLDFFVQMPTYQLNIGGHESSGHDWYLIAPPVAFVTPTEDNGFLTSTAANYDLYRFNQSAAAEWENYKAVDGEDNPLHPDFTTLVNGKGYLYANANDVTLYFTGHPYKGDGVVALIYDEDARLAGYNLIGNPFNSTAYLADKRDFYRMNEEGSGVIINTNPDGGGNAIAAFEGILVIAEDEDDNSVIFQTTEPETSTGNNNSMLNITVSQAKSNRGKAVAVDAARICFGEGKQLPKFQLFENSTKLYIPQGDNDFAVVRGNAQGDMPLNFKAKELGTYTISFEGEEMDLNGIYLIDMLDEEEIDLSVNPSYTFIGSPADRSARFKIVFKNNGNDSTSDIFAYQSGSDIVVSGEGELQIFDVMGRMVARQNVNGVQTINAMAHGVYIFKLNEKTQKIIVK